MTLKLYTLCGADTARHFSPHVWKTVMSLHHKGLDFEECPTPFTAIPEIEGGATKTVPLLVDGDTMIVDSFAIAEYLEETYPDAPSLFGGAGGVAAARFVERWSLTHMYVPLRSIIIMDIFNRLSEKDQAYFRSTREVRFGKPLEELAAGGAAQIDALSANLETMRQTLSFHPFLGDEAPLFSDYIVFGGLQWARVISPIKLLADDDPVSAWFERCLDLFEGAGRKVPAAA